MLHLLRGISRSLLTSLAAAALLLSLSPACFAHDESVPCTIDLVIYPDRTHVDLKFPLQSMLNGDASADPSNSVRVKQPDDIARIDRDAYAKSKAQQMSEGLRITYDGVELKPTVLKVSTD